MIASPMSGQPKNVTSSAVVNANPSELIGFYVNSTSSGTIVFHDSADSTNNAISGTITPAIGWHFFPASLGIGLRVVIANTLNVTLIYKPGG